MENEASKPDPGSNTEGQLANDLAGTENGAAATADADGGNVTFKDRMDNDGPSMNGNRQVNEPGAGSQKKQGGDNQTTKKRDKAPNVDDFSKGQIINNNAQIFFKNIAAAESEAEKIDFTAFLKRNYNESVIIPEMDEEARRQFENSRVVVINYATGHSLQATSTVERVISEAPLAADFQAVRCTLQLQTRLTATKLIRSFTRHRLFSRQKKQMLVIFENREETELINLFLSGMREKGGVADSVTDLLKEKNIFLIYVCQYPQLYDRKWHLRLHFGLLLLHPIILGFYEVLKDYGKALFYYYEVTEVALLGGWMSGLSDDEKNLKLSGLIRNGLLDGEIAQARQNINPTDERQAVSALLADSLKNIILFIAVFFDGIQLSEFDMLVRLLVAALPAKPQDEENYISTLTWDWEIGADQLLTECGLFLDLSANKKSPAYSFEKMIRKDTALELLKTKFRLLLARRYEIIEQKLLANDMPCSGPLMEGWFGLAFENAPLNADRYLIRTAISMVDLIAASDENKESEEIRKGQFSRLLHFVRSWGDREDLRPSTGKFYDLLKQDEARRGVLAALLSHQCTPDKPENLSRLKAHLESTGSKEVLANFQLIRQILFNYSDYLRSFFDVVDAWINADGRLTKASAQVRCACLFTFYECWPDKRDAQHLSNRLLKQAVNFNAAENISLLAEVVLSDKMNMAFDIVYLREYQEEYDQGYALKRAMTDDLHLLFAFVLIQWYYLLSLIRGDSTEEEWTPHELMSNAIAVPVREQQREWLRSALNRAITILNYLIVEHTYSREKENPAFWLKTKRDLARQILTFF